MKAVVYDRYGPPDVLHIEDVPKPEPKEGEVLVRVRASTVNRLDVHTREANVSNGRAISVVSRLISGVRAPRRRILGSEFAGEVEAVGAGVGEFKPGDEVFGLTGLRYGAHAEYVAVRARSRIALKPANMSFEEAAAVPDGFTNALGCLRQTHLAPGRTVLVYGASGSIGVAGVQLARHHGADITAVLTEKNFELLRSLGAREVIDYTRQDFTTNGKRYDVIFDAVGKHSFARAKGSLNPGGWYLATDGMRNLLLTPWTRLFGDKKVSFTVGSPHPKQDMAFLKRLIESGEYRAVIDRRYPMDEVVEATAYVESQQKVGNVVLQIA
ncbi:MAG TPA: NAD(P)-dependent alcohol dehydrogenase [Candidatus Dormibacteraeota bacterium]|nr:NAD(P)-dependent alcohol dehydrogenase [Candidatus Dormibacteraeota bacterium]